MVRHIVFWRVRGENADERKANARKIKETLEALNGRIPGLRKLEVGIDWSGSPESSDVALYSELDSREALGAYQSHPEHQAVLPIVRALVTERRVVDYD